MCLKRFGNRQHHWFRPANESHIYGFDVDPGPKQRGAFITVDTATEQINLLAFVLKDVDHIQSAEKFVLQILELFAKHDRIRVSVGIDQRKSRQRFTFQTSAQDRQERRDPRSARKPKVMRCLGFGFCVEVSKRRHCFHNIADRKFRIGPGRKGTAWYPFYSNLQFPIVLASADRIRAANFLALKIALKGQVLSLSERKITATHGLQRDHDCIADGFFDIGYFEFMKLGHLPRLICI